MARVSKNQRSSILRPSSRPSTSRRRVNRLRDSTRSDVYEYQSHKVRRAHISLSLDKMKPANMPRLIGESVEDEDVPSEDDEELDSDAAFEESDEERFAGFSFPRPRGKTFVKASSTGSDSGDYVNVLDVFDGRADSIIEEALPANHAHANSQGIGSNTNTDAEEGKDTEVEEVEDAPGEEEPDGMLSADEDVNPSALEGLRSWKRKGDTDVTNNSLQRKRRFMEERTAVGIEGEFTAVASGQQLRLDDLLAPLASHSAAGLSLKKTVKILDPSRTRGAPLSAPLPQRTQDRLDREAAYEQTKTEPSTQLETAVDQLLKRAQMREEDLQKTEELKMNHLSAEEVASRRAEIMKTRELLFRAEMKAKRIAKIKSKTYRRLKRRGKEKHLGDNTSFKREAERAKERATLRHKSTGKWAKSMRRRGEMDDDQLQDMTEMLERGDKLRRKIQGGKESSDIDEDSDGDGSIQLKARVFDELAELKRDDSGLAKGRGKSVFDMKFMQDAAAREQREVDQKVDDLMEELQDLDAHEDEVDDPKLPEDDSSVTIQRIGGRVSLRPSGLTSISVRVPAPSDASSTTLKSTDNHSLPTATPTMSPVDPQNLSVSHNQPTQQPHSDRNPWLSRNGQPSYTALKKNDIVVSNDSTSAVKAKNKLRKRQRGTKDEMAKIQEDSVLEISPTDALVAPLKGSLQAGAEAGSYSSDGDGQVEEQEDRLVRNGKPPGGMRHGFAGDNVVKEFEEAKRREVEEDAPQEVDTSLPGWGAWGGQGTRKTAPKSHAIKKIAGVNPQSRADFGKAHVIISEKRDKKAAKYLTKDLPYPYTSKAQFERSLETPIGREWNTRIASQRATMPKVTKKMGTIIRPLEKRF
ncbi:Utp14 protein-domain-containing protein [Russula vinacea]|nr:Utp14 protein-domain-containing protein [Russula vinacea]